MTLEQSPLGQLLLLLVGAGVGLGLGRRISSNLWLIPIAAVPWLGLAATQVFC